MKKKKSGKILTVYFILFAWCFILTFGAVAFGSEKWAGVFGCCTCGLMTGGIGWAVLWRYISVRYLRKHWVKVEGEITTYRTQLVHTKRGKREEFIPIITVEDEEVKGPGSTEKPIIGTKKIVWFDPQYPEDKEVYVDPGKIMLFIGIFFMLWALLCFWGAFTVDPGSVYIDPALK